MLHVMSVAPPSPPAVLARGADGDLSVLAGKSVLLVEDEVFIAAELKRVLEMAGAEVTYARTLARAVHAAETERFDGAVLDVTLGAASNCVPVADRLRADDVPFLLHSGDLIRQGEVIERLDAPVVPKPAAAEVVIGALAALLR